MMLIQVAPGQSLQTVIDALPADDQPVTIHLAPGVYEEKIALRRPHTRIEGESAETTRITWHDGAAEILAARSARQRCSSMPATAHSAT